MLQDENKNNIKQTKSILLNSSADKVISQIYLAKLIIRQECYYSSKNKVLKKVSIYYSIFPPPV